MNLHLDILEVNFYDMKLLLEDELRLNRPSLSSIRKKKSTEGGNELGTSRVLA